MRREEIKKYFHGSEPWLNIFILSPITITITQLWIRRTNLGPDILTFLSLILGVMAGISFGFDQVILGVFLYFFSYVLDAVDGKVARIRNGSSKYGAWFDILVDRTVFSFCVVGLSVSTLSDYEQILVPAALIFLFQLGFESRYNIQFHKVKKALVMNDYDSLKNWHAARDDSEPDLAKVTKYRKWTIERGVITSPISLVELLFVLFIIAPLTGYYLEAAYTTIIVLTLRLLLQQRYWLS